MRHIVWSLITAVVVIASLGSCSLIDDNFDGCDNESTRNIDCRLHIYSDIDSVLVSQIKGTDGDDLHSALLNYYKALLSPANYSVGLDIYDATTNLLQNSYNEQIAGGNGVISLSLPLGDLRCVAQTEQPKYSGRLDMPEGQSSYTLHMYPADAQVAVAAKVDNSIKEVLVTVEGCASSYNAADSTYTYYNNVDTLAFAQGASAGSWLTYAGAVLPSNPSESWTVTVYATTSTGSITRTVLTISRPLLPGDIRIFQIAIGADGAASTTDLGVGASVTLDWKKGGDYNPEI